MTLCLLCYVEGATSIHCGEPADAVRRLREGLRVYDENDRETHIRVTGQDMPSLLRFHLAMAEWLAGMPDRAMDTSDASLEISRRGANPFSLALVVAEGAVLRVLAGDWQAAERLGLEARSISTQYGIPNLIAYGNLMAGTAIAAQGPRD